MDNVVAIARRHLAGLRAEEKGDKGEKVSPEVGFSPLYPFSPAPYSGKTSAIPTFVSWVYQAEARRLMEAADALVEHLGLDGTHPEIAQAAAIVGSALALRDIETLRTWVFEFEVVVKRLYTLQIAKQQERCKSGEETATE